MGGLTVFILGCALLLFWLDNEVVKQELKDILMRDLNRLHAQSRHITIMCERFMDDLK